MKVLDLLFPASCLGCKKPGNYICPTCLSQVQVLHRFNSHTQTLSIFSYEGIIRQAIIKIKYNFAFDIAPELASVCVPHLQNSVFMSPNSILVPIPLHKKRENWRGFNQAEIIGRPLATKLNYQFTNSLLIRQRATKPQVGLPKSDRVRNIRGKFAVKTSLNPTATYIIFDDVVTTGSTLHEAIKVFKDAGAQKVFGLTVTR